MQWIITDLFLGNEINPSKYHLVVCHKIVRNHSLESSGTVHDDENWLILLIHIENVDTSESTNGHVNHPVCRLIPFSCSYKRADLVLKATNKKLKMNLKILAVALSMVAAQSMNPGVDLSRKKCLSNDKDDSGYVLKFDLLIRFCD